MVIEELHRSDGEIPLVRKPFQTMPLPRIGQQNDVFAVEPQSALELKRFHDRDSAIRGPVHE